MGRILAMTRISYKDWKYPYSIVVKWPTDKTVKVPINPSANAYLDVSLPSLKVLVDNHLIGFRGPGFPNPDNPAITFYPNDSIAVVLNLTTMKAKVFYVERMKSMLGSMGSQIVEPRFQGIAEHSGTAFLIDFVREKVRAIDTFAIDTPQIRKGINDFIEFYYSDTTFWMKGNTIKTWGKTYRTVATPVEGDVIVVKVEDSEEFPPFNTFRILTGKRLTAENPKPRLYDPPLMAFDTETFLRSRLWDWIGYIHKIGDNKIIRIDYWPYHTDNKVYYTGKEMLYIFAALDFKYSIAYDKNGQAVEDIKRGIRPWCEIYCPEQDKTVIYLDDCTVIIPGFFKNRFAKFCGGKVFEGIPKRGDLSVRESGVDLDLYWENYSLSNANYSEYNFSYFTWIDLMKEIDLSNYVLDGYYQE